MSLRARLLVGLTLLVLAAVGSAGWLVLEVARVRLATAQQLEARQLAGQLVSLLSSGYDPTLPPESTDDDIERRDFFSEMKKREF